MNKYEQLIEHIINDNEQAARELFHEIVVERSRDIYESIMDEEAMEEEIGGNQVSGLVDEITQDETDGLGENDEAGEEPALGGDEMDHDFGDEGGEMDHDFGGEAGEDDLEDKFRSIEDALEDLKAEFADLMGNESGEEPAGDIDGDGDLDEPGDIDGDGDLDEPGEPEFGQHKVGADEGMMEAAGQSGKSGSAQSGKSGSSKSGKSGSGLSESELMREYVEKIQDFYKGTEGEGHTVGTGGDEPNVNTQGIVASENDMGGTAGNLNQGGGNQNQDGLNPAGKADGKLQKTGSDLIGDVMNRPGGDAGKKAFKANQGSYEKAKGKEGKQVGSDGSVAINSKSEIGGRVR